MGKTQQSVGGFGRSSNSSPKSGRNTILSTSLVIENNRNLKVTPASLDRDALDAGASYHQNSSAQKNPKSITRGGIQSLNIIPPLNNKRFNN